MNSIELFTGAGGLCMGMSLAGLKHLAVIEKDKWACETIKENARRNYPLVKDWPLYKGFVQEYDFSQHECAVDILAGGPPCQPFSLGGKHQGRHDKRDMFPVFIDILGVLKPKVFIVENVKGLTRKRFYNYLEYIKLRLTYPLIKIKDNETWYDHLQRLEEYKTKGIFRSGLSYELVSRVINAADYGVPQYRERLFIIGFRSDLGVNWSFNEIPPTHSKDRLFYDQWVTGHYWDKNNIGKKEIEFIRMNTKINHNKITPDFEKKPWRTSRETFLDMGNSKLMFNHKYQKGARIYKGHTGSPLDMPAKTLKAGDHGVPGGENMLRRPDNTVRYFTVREAARLQTFPDNYVFHGSWSENMRQLGNAVPVYLSYIISSSIVKCLITREEKIIKQEMYRAR